MDWAYLTLIVSFLLLIIGSQILKSQPAKLFKWRLVCQSLVTISLVLNAIVALQQSNIPFFVACAFVAAAQAIVIIIKIKDLKQIANQ